MRAQILIAGGMELSDAAIDMPQQNKIACNGFAIQCRITTEDPQND